MPLSSQRLSPSPSLTRCVDEGYRMMAGEPDSDAVKRLQLALSDLGYEQISRIDGIWGEETSSAVVRFKLDESLEPHDAVASHGTVGQLDQYFSWEPEDPDLPDPSASGLADLVKSRMVEAASSIEASLSVIGTLHWGQPDDGSEGAWRSALQTHRGIDVSDGGDAFPPARTLMEGLLSASIDALTSGEITVHELDRAGWQAETGYSFYSANDYRLSQRQIRVMPAFRNALTPTDQAEVILRIAARTVDPSLHVLGYPGTARYGSLSAEDRSRNLVGLAALVLFLSSGFSEPIHPAPIWGDLSSFPGS